MGLKPSPGVPFTTLPFSHTKIFGPEILIIKLKEISKK